MFLTDLIEKTPEGDQTVELRILFKFNRAVLCR